MGIFETLKYTSSTTDKRPATNTSGTANVPQDIKDLWAKVNTDEEKRKEAEKKKQQAQGAQGSKW